MRRFRLGIKSQIIMAGLVLAVAVFGLEWLEYKYFVRSLSSQAYILILVTAFTGVGIWVGHKLSKPRSPEPETELNEKALAALGITHREHAVLVQLATGGSNKQIARDLGISPNTVKTHIANLYAKLKVGGRMQAVDVARELGILTS